MSKQFYFRLKKTREGFCRQSHQNIKMLS